jgi:hypothetical protein
MINRPVFNPMLNVIFSDRVHAHPSDLIALDTKSLHVLSENSCSKSERMHSRIRNSLASVNTTSPSARTRARGLSVKTNKTKQTGGTHEWSLDTSR